MQKDIRGTPLYRETQAVFEMLRQPGSGQISDAGELHVSPDGQHAVFAGILSDSLESEPHSRICEIDLSSGSTRVLTLGPNTDRLPRYAPHGRQIAFLSDRHKSGDFQLFLFDRASGAARSAPRVEGWVEYLQWSPDGRRILLGVAGHGADVSGGQGAITSKRSKEDAPLWMPVIDAGDEDYRWRRVWVYDTHAQTVTCVSPNGTNIWEATWCGNEAIAAVTSPGPAEGLWYTARIHLIDCSRRSIRELFIPEDQLGWPAGSPDGSYLAVVEAVCSDRYIVAGDLRLLESASGQVRKADTRGVNVTHAEWRSGHRILVAGLRGFETVVGVYDLKTSTFAEVWRSMELGTTGRYITASGLGPEGDCVLTSEGFARAPEIAVVRNGRYSTVKSFDMGYGEFVRGVGVVEGVEWQGRDGLGIQGWLFRPAGPGPHPLVVHAHGGPVWSWRQYWLGRGSNPFTLMLVRHGYAVFMPNPRGSSGRGQEFARQVVGEMGGEDAQDCLRGIDHLVGKGIADPKRLGITGGSYGGYMAAWLITQDSRFAAAIPVAPVINFVTEHLVSNIPHFVSLFLRDTYTRPGGKYFQRSPLMHAHKVATPTLSVCGAMDRCTPPEEAVQFHNALLENGVNSILLTYPEEGHGVRRLPASIDFIARAVGWFEEHMPATGRGTP